MNLFGALLIVVFGFLFVTVSSRLTGEIGSSSNPISGMTVATLLLTCLIFLVAGLDRAAATTSPRSRSAASSASPPPTAARPRRISRPASCSAPRRALSRSPSCSARSPRRWSSGPILLALNDAATVYVPPASGASAPIARRRRFERFRASHLTGPQAQDDAGAYRVWQKTDDAGGEPGSYLVDDAGRAGYLVDPGINGTHRTRPDGIDRHQVRRAQGDADELHHQGHPEPPAALGAGDPRR